MARAPIGRRRPRNGGFSLIEMIMVIVIVGIIGSIGGMMLSSGFRAYFTGLEVTAIDWQGRLALERMGRELREIRSATAADLQKNPATQITFTDTGGTTISYALSGTTLQRNGRPLADGITALTFSYIRNDGKTTAAAVTDVYYVTCDLSVTRGAATRSLRLTIHPRNL